MSKNGKILKEYKNVFIGIGCSNSDPYHINMDKNAVPVVHPFRRVPIPLLVSFKNRLVALI